MSKNPGDRAGRKVAMGGGKGGRRPQGRGPAAYELQFLALRRTAKSNKITITAPETIAMI